MEVHENRLSFMITRARRRRAGDCCLRRGAVYFRVSRYVPDLSSAACGRQAPARHAPACASFF